MAWRVPAPTPHCPTRPAPEGARSGHAPATRVTARRWGSPWKPCAARAINRRSPGPRRACGGHRHLRRARPWPAAELNTYDHLKAIPGAEAFPWDIGERGIRLVADGTCWRPRDGRQVIVQRGRARTRPHHHLGAPGHTPRRRARAPWRHALAEHWESTTATVSSQRGTARRSASKSHRGSHHRPRAGRAQEVPCRELLPPGPITRTAITHAAGQPESGTGIPTSCATTFARALLPTATNGLACRPSP